MSALFSDSISCSCFFGLSFSDRIVFFLYFLECVNVLFLLRFKFWLWLSACLTSPSCVYCFFFFLIWFYPMNTDVALSECECRYDMCCSPNVNILINMCVRRKQIQTIN